MEEMVGSGTEASQELYIELLTAHLEPRGEQLVEKRTILVENVVLWDSQQLGSFFCRGLRAVSRAELIFLTLGTLLAHKTGILHHDL